MNKIKLNIEDIFEIPTARIYNPDHYKPLRKVSIDSRTVKKGSLFIAIKGKKFDGHEFINQSVRNGASTVMINRRMLRNYDGVTVPIIAVDNTTKALGHVAKLWRKKLDVKIIGITGSSGKTTTKDMLTTLLSEKFSVNKTIRNNNNHIGVPLTILSTNEKHDVLVAELGTNHFGEIEYSSNILEPDFSLITNIGSSHIKYLKNKKGVLKEKVKLYDLTKKNNGTLFINYDDPMLKGYAQKFDDFVSFGFNNKADVRGKIIGYNDDGRPLVQVKYKNKVLKNPLPLYGEQSALNYLAAVSIALKLGLSKEQLQNGTKKFKQTKGRIYVHKKKNFTLVDEHIMQVPIR